MNDCPNAEVRDLLPDLMHDRLDARTRARVVAHVDGCADCRSELELLRSLRGSLDRATPRVDVNRIVAALPTPASVRPSQPRRAWRALRGLNDWRIAAAVTFIVAGGTSLVVMRDSRDGGGDSASAPAVRHVANAASETTADVSGSARAESTILSPAPNATTAAVPSRPRPESASVAPVRPVGAESVASADDQSAGLANSRIGDLNAKQLKSLLNAIENMDATPSTEPDPVVLRVGPRTSSPNGL
jgi:hypothetical protein